MDERKWVDRFQNDIDPLRAQEQQPEPEEAPEEYRQMLEVASRLSRADYSQDSRIYASARAKLKDQAEHRLGRRAGRFSLRHSLPTAVRYAGMGICLLGFILGMGWVIERFVPGVIPGKQPSQQVTLGPAIILEQYMGDPKPIIIDIGGQQQTAAIGSYCWAKERNGTQTTQVCADSFSYPTPADPLVISSPVSARLLSPIPATPERLTMILSRVDEQTDLADRKGTTLYWKFKPGELVYLPLQPEPHFELALETGLYNMIIQASWKELGNVDYGFLVRVDRSLPTGTPIYATTEPMPTAPPGYPTEAPTEEAKATSSPAEPEGFYATQQAARQTQIAARATASPFPTALPANLQPGSPASGVTKRGPLSLEVRLAKDEFVAGEGGLAEVTLHNDGPEPLFIDGDGAHPAWATLLDHAGHSPTPWPFSWTRNMPGPAYLQKLEPGQTLTETVQFQIPPAEQKPDSSYDFWVETRFSRPDPLQPEGADNVWLRLECGPIQLKVTPPGDSNQLNVSWTAGRSGWNLTVSGQDGRAPVGPVWGEVGATSGGATTGGPLRLNENGAYAGSWSEGLFMGDAEMLTGGWIAAQGYVTQLFSQTIAGKEVAGIPLPDMSQPGLPQKSFPSLEQAQANTAISIHLLTRLPDGASASGVVVEWSGTDQMNILQDFQLPGSKWLELTQMVYSQADQYGGWGQARYDMEAQAVSVNGLEGYFVQHAGWLRLDWKADGMGFELSAPAQSMSLADMIQLAAGLK